MITQLCPGQLWLRLRPAETAGELQTELCVPFIKIQYNSFASDQDTEVADKNSNVRVVINSLREKERVV